MLKISNMIIFTGVIWPFFEIQNFDKFIKSTKSPINFCKKNHKKFELLRYCAVFGIFGFFYELYLVAFCKIVNLENVIFEQNLPIGVIFEIFPKNAKSAKNLPYWSDFSENFCGMTRKQTAQCAKSSKIVKKFKVRFPTFSYMYEFTGGVYLRGIWDFFPKSTSTFEISFPQSLSEWHKAI